MKSLITLSCAVIGLGFSVCAVANDPYCQITFSTATLDYMNQDATMSSTGWQKVDQGSGVFFIINKDGDNQEIAPIIGWGASNSQYVFSQGYCDAVKKITAVYASNNAPPALKALKSVGGYPLMHYTPVSPSGFSLTVPQFYTESDLWKKS